MGRTRNNRSIRFRHRVYSAIPGKTCTEAGINPKAKKKSEIMAFSPFKLFIALAAALAILYFFLTYLGPLFFWPKNVQEQISGAIVTATMYPGKAIEAKETVYDSGMQFSNQTFREQQIETKFECDSPSNCCDKGTKCNNAIEWTESYAGFKQKKTIETFARCDSQHNIFACTVYFGQKPAQVKIANTSALNEIDLKTQNQCTIDLLIKNDGAVQAPSVFITTKLFKYNQAKTAKQLMQEKKSGELELMPGAQTLFPIDLQIELPGSYIAEILVEGENAGFDQNMIEFTAKGTALSPCKTGSKGSTVLNPETGNCETAYDCMGCNFAFECRNAWATADPAKNFEEEDAAHAITTSNAINGGC